MIELANKQLEDVSFSWHAFGVEDGKIFVSDGSVEDSKNKEIIEPVAQIVDEPGAETEELTEEIFENEIANEEIAEEVSENEAVEVVEEIVEEAKEVTEEIVID